MVVEAGVAHVAVVAHLHAVPLLLRAVALGQVVRVALSVGVAVEQVQLGTLNIESFSLS